MSAEIIPFVPKQRAGFRWRSDVPTIQQADIDQMCPAMIRLGLGLGALVENADGSVSPADDVIPFPPRREG